MRAGRREGCGAGETRGVHSVKQLCHEERAQALLVDLRYSATDIVQLREAGEIACSWDWDRDKNCLRQPTTLTGLCVGRSQIERHKDGFVQRQRQQW